MASPVKQQQERQQAITDYACQRATPLKHFNEKLTVGINLY